KLRGSQVAPGCLATSCPIDNQPLQAWPILQLDDMSFILGLPRGFKHSEPPEAGRETSHHSKFGCGCADRAAHPVGLHFAETSCRRVCLPVLEGRPPPNRGASPEEQSLVSDRP